MATIREVAAKAQVSISTVSLAINSSPLVKPETRERIMEAVEELGYVPNNSARSLRSKVMNSLGVIILSEHEQSSSYDFQYETGLFSQSIINGISRRLFDTDYSLILEYYTPSSADGELPKLIRNARVDGVFIVGNLYDRDFIEQIKSTGLPFVVVGHGKESADYDSVWADVSEGIYLSMEYLMKHGCRNIGYLNCPKNFRSNYARSSAIEQSCVTLGMEFNRDFLVNCEHNSGEGGYLAMKQLWESGLKIDSVIAANAPIAIGALRYLQEQRLSVPEDVSVVAYEDSVLCGYSIPPLSAVNIQKERMGEAAASLLLKRLSKADRPWKTQKIHPYIVERDSVLCK